MTVERRKDVGLTDEGVQADLRRQPHLMLKLAENALTVAENLRDNYFRNTTKFIKHLRQRVYGDHQNEEPLLKTFSADAGEWALFRGEVVTFIDGGIGKVELSSQIPILLRVGSYSVKTGATKLSERESFGYYPVILGNLDGGSKERKDFTDIVRITAELLAGLSALHRTSELRVLMFHGPLVYMMGAYAGHTPWTEGDIDLFLEHYSTDPSLGKSLKDEFLRKAKVDLYPRMTQRPDEWVKRCVFEPLSWMAFLYRKLIQFAQSRRPVPIIAGVVERGGTLTEFSRNVLLERVFRGLRTKGNESYFNEMFGRKDLTTPKALLDKLGYTDSLLLGMLLRCGDRSEDWMVDKYGGLREMGRVSLPGEAYDESVDFSALRQIDIGFPRVSGFYIHVAETTEPIRIEIFTDLGGEQVENAAERCFLYSRLLPQYGFPVGLDIADKHAKIPAWMTDAYAKMIRHHLGVSLQHGEIKDAELRRILVQAIYMTHRDWLFRPRVKM